MAGTIKFLIFYGAFIGAYLLFGSWGFNDVIMGNTSPDTNYTFNQTGQHISAGFIQNYFSLSSSFFWLNVLIFTPFAIVLVYVIVCLVRGVPPV
jgi:hypothetical protein